MSQSRQRCAGASLLQVFHSTEGKDFTVGGTAAPANQTSIMGNENMQGESVGEIEPTGTGVRSKK